jgi:two-component system, NarL family, invasion response regulator UvrY
MRILIADDHAIVRRGLKQLLLEHYPFAEIVEAADAEQLISHVIKDSEWNVVICDLNMPGRSGLDALRVIRAGASGYLGKETIHDDLIKAVEAVKLGKRYITPGLAEKLADAASPNASAMMLPHEILSDREFDVFKLLADGKQVSEIATQLSLSATTVSTYRSRIMDKMNMKSNAELAKYAVEHRLL